MTNKKRATPENALTSTQNNPRKYQAGKRRVTIYNPWDFKVEAGAELADFDNRWPSTLEFRRAMWPALEFMRKHDQGIANQLIHGVLNNFFKFQDFVEEATGQPVPHLQRVDQTGNRQLLDERVLADTDTLMVLSLDHLHHRHPHQTITPGEVELLKEFLSREGTCLVLSPHHDVGAADDHDTRVLEHKHHGDWTVGGQERFSGFARSIFSALDIPVENRYGLNPAKAKGTDEPAPLKMVADDPRGFLTGVSTLNAHFHLPHLAITDKDAKGVVVLARQLINSDATPHPFVRAGNKEFNAVVWIPPAGKRAGDILIADLTVWTLYFRGEEGTKRLWKNLAGM